MTPKKRSTNKKNDEKSAQAGSSQQSAGGPSKYKLPAGYELVTLPLSVLQPHPLQTQFNPECSAEENTALQLDLEANGQRDPIHVLPPGNKAGLPAYVMLDGHRRHAALLKNGEKTATVIIRRDLLEADAATVELLFLKFNQNRRQLDPLAFACNLVRQHEIANDVQHGQLHPYDFGRIAKTLSAVMNGMSLKNSRRYIHVACTPLAIQNAVRMRRLKLDLAARVNGLTQLVQASIAKRIAKKTDKGEIHAIILPIVRKNTPERHKWKPIHRTTIALRLIKKMKQDLADCPCDYGHLHGPTLKPFLADLTEIKNAIDALIKATERPGGSVEELLVPLLEAL